MKKKINETVDISLLKQKLQYAQPAICVSEMYNGECLLSKNSSQSVSSLPNIIGDGDGEFDE